MIWFLRIFGGFLVLGAFFLFGINIWNDYFNNGAYYISRGYISSIFSFFMGMGFIHMANKNKMFKLFQIQLEQLTDFQETKNTLSKNQQISSLSALIIKDHNYFTYSMYEHNLKILTELKELKELSDGKKAIINEINEDYIKIIKEKMKQSPNITLKPDQVDIGFGPIQQLKLEKKIEDMFQKLNES